MTKKRYEIKQHKVEKDTGFDVSKTAQLGQILKESYLISYPTIISQDIFYDFNFTRKKEQKISHEIVGIKKL